MEQAEGGTLFLDEVGELPLPMQAKLLKVIQDGCITRLGDTRARRVDFRLVVATNQDLARSVETGHFRLDLYYRLNVIPVTLPPLRERREDIPGLVERHLQRLNTRYGRDKIIARDAWQTLMGWEWPGNVRELENWLERAWLSAGEDVIRPRQETGQPDGTERAVTSMMEGEASVRRPGLAEGETLQSALARTERDILAELCREANSTYAIAERLGISQPSVVRKLRRHGLRIERSR
ncbi:Nif-specific regulatory protein [Halomonas elongata]|nr:Nif-specific regulatory protein [Halomonas elongata]